MLKVFSYYLTYVAIVQTAVERPYELVFRELTATFPFPDGFRQTPPDAVTDAAKKLHEARERWLNPDVADEAILKKRTLTALCNEREAGRATWLNNLHRGLDQAVLSAYGWSDLAGSLFAAENVLRAANPKADALGPALLGRPLTLNLEWASSGIWLERSNGTW